MSEPAVNEGNAFYIGKLGFGKPWHSAEGKGTVCQVNRGGCEIILCEDRARDDKARLFVELNRDGLDAVISSSVSRVGDCSSGCVANRSSRDRSEPSPRLPVLR